MARRSVFYGWVVVGAASLIVCVGLGTLFSLGVFLQPIALSTGWSRSAISGIALINWIFMGLGSFMWGALCDRFGGRVVGVGGGLLVGLGMVLSSQVTTIWQLYATFGGLVGLGVGAFYAPLTATAIKWFVRQRGLAVSLVSAGIGLGTFVIAPLARWLTSAWDWRVAMLVLGDLAWLVIVPLSLLLREAPRDVRAEAERVATPGGQFSTSQILGTPQFWAIALTHFACCAAHSGPIFHMVTHAIDQGVPAMAAATMLGVSGLSSITGRVGCGMLADRFGAKRTLIAGLCLQASIILLYVFVHTTASFYLLGAIFGVAYGGVMPLYALVVRSYFGDRAIGAAYGGVFLVSTLGMGLGSFAGGFIYDHLGSYAWMFLGSAMIGGGAMLMAFTFRPPRSLAVAVPVAQAAI